MIYQAHFNPNQHDVMKDKYRVFEHEANRNYWIYMFTVTIFIFITIILTYSVHESAKGYQVTKTVDNMLILGI